FTTMRTAFPDLHVDVEHLVADDENVAFAYRITGTHQGEFQGIAPTGQRVDARGMQISRFVDGRITERWGSSDEAGIIKQLGGG
ncbi:MAG: ester cyclase, partial [Acidimicrobiia bacterium]|nr:ester cyclase [Acidimicrobiia bacterium]